MNRTDIGCVIVSNILNEPRIKNPLIKAIREQLELGITIADGGDICEIRFVRK